MNFIRDIYKFISYLTFVDLIFFAAIIVLLILIVTLIYFIKINSDNYENISSNKDLESKEESKKEKVDMIMKNLELEESNDEKEIEEYNDEEGELLDLESLTKKLQDEKDEQVNISKYEKDQEEKAIISYDELLQKHNKYALNYEKEEVLDDLIVKKVNLNDLVNTEEKDDSLDVRVISYQKEEAFLSALKELNKLLN